MVGSTIFFHRILATPASVLELVLLPTTAAAGVGTLFGGRILNADKTRSLGDAMLMGIFLSGMAFAVFSVLYAVTLPFVEQRWTLKQSAGLFLFTSTFGLLLAAPIVLAGGLLSGTALYLLRMNLKKVGQSVENDNVSQS